MAFLRRRLFSTTIFRRVNLAHYEGPGPTRATPSPTNMDPLLNSPELQQLGKKAKGPWKEFSKEEAVKRKYFKLLYCICLFGDVVLSK